jgi:predicted nucleic acid-binding protein
MLVVADSSPVIALVHAELIDLLPALFGEIVVPPEVLAEIRSPKRSEMVRRFIATPPAWLQERSPTTVEVMPLLDAGEMAAISLALELRADLLLIDETEGRRAAAQRRIPLTGTVGILERAADIGLVELENAFDRLKRTDFWIPAALLDERFQIWRDEHRRPGGGRHG